jgi:hypothetical protein
MAQGTPKVDRVRDSPCPVCAGPRATLAAPCPACFGTGVSERRCRECFAWRPVAEYLSGGRLGRRCRSCRERVQVPRHTSSDYVSSELRVKFVRVARNGKTGPIPVSMTSPNTCPPACPWMGHGCYGEQNFVGMHWRRLAGGTGMTWDDFCAEVAKLPRGQLWRHDEAGDLPGDGDVIDQGLLKQLHVAAAHTRGFTYTHKPVLGDGVARENRQILDRLRDYPGLTTNLSADGLEEADEKAALDLGPVAVVIPDDGRSTTLRTPGGRLVVVCPAVRRTVGGDEEAAKKVTCATCALCQRGRRKSIVAFPAHGNFRRRMGESLVQLRLFG